MSRSESPLDPVELLAHLEWVRGLARGLVADEGLAEDLVQETWLAASRAPAPLTGQVRAWLGRIVRNLAGMQHRSRSRREAREERSARSEALPSAAELAEHAALQREVVGEVLALDEPFRETVLRRWFLGQLPAAIAEELGVPVTTVHSRLRRGHQRLRDRLEERHGGREGMLAALLPWIEDAPPALVGTPPVGSASVSSAPLGTLATLTLATLVQVKLQAAAAVLVVLGLIAFLPDGGGSPQREGAAPEPPEAARLQVPLAPGQEVVDAASVERVGVATVEEADEVPAAPAPLTFHGRVVDVAGAGVAGVDVVSRLHVDRADAPRFTTGADGRFDGQLSPRGSGASSDENALMWEFVVSDEDWVTLRLGDVHPSLLDDEQLIVAAPATQLSGSVVDPAGLGIEGARVELSDTSTTFHGFAHPLNRTELVELAGVTDSAGQLELEHFPSARGLRLDVSAAGYRSTTVRLDEQPRPYVFELTPLEDLPGHRIEGLVVTEDGVAVPEAQVQLGLDRTLTGPDGRFRLHVRHAQPHGTLVASSEGYLPAYVEDFGERLQSAEEQPAPVRLELGPAPVTLRGRVVDADGNGLEWWHVRLVDEHALFSVTIPPQTIEGLARGETFTNVARITDADGRFEIRGLYPREYTLEAICDATLLRAETVVRGGDTDVVLRTSERLVGPVAGRVVDRSGRPVEGASVTVGRDRWTTPFGVDSLHGDQEAVTDAEGRFALDGVPDAELFLRAGGAGLWGSRHDVEGDLLAREHRIVVDRSCRVRIELDDPSSATHARFLDEDGEELITRVHNARSWTESAAVDLAGGSSKEVVVSDAAVTLVLSSPSGRASHPIQLSPETVNVLRF